MTYAKWVTETAREAHQEAIAAYGFDDPACGRLAVLLARTDEAQGKAWATLRAAVEKRQQQALNGDDDLPADGEEEPECYGDAMGLYGDPDEVVYGMLRGAALMASDHPLLSGRLTPGQRDALIARAGRHLRAAVDALDALGVRVRGRDFDGLDSASCALERYHMIGTTPEDFARGPEVLDAVRGVLDRLLKADLLADVVLPVALDKLRDLEREPLPPRVADDDALEKKIAGCVMERLCVMYLGKRYRVSVAALVGAMFGDYEFDSDSLKDAMRRLGPYVCWF